MSADDNETPDTVAGPRPRARRRLLLRLALAGFVLVGALVALLPMILSTGAVRGVILAWLDENLDRKVQFEKLDVSWAHGIRLTGLTVEDETPGRPLLTAPLIELDAPILPLLMRRVEVEKFVIKDPVLHVASRGEKKTNVDDVVKKKKVRKKGAAEEEEETVLPEVRVPVEVRNLTIVFHDAEGREARRGGIDFDGHVDTRQGPTTFDLKVPAGGVSKIRVVGTASLFAADGTFLPAAERKVRTVVAVDHVDARENGDLLALFLGDTPASGVLDGKVVVDAVGKDADAEVDLRLSRLGYGDAVKAAAARQGDDLTIVGKIGTKGEGFRVEGLKVRAEGLVIDADLAGGFESMDGRASVDADFAKLAAALRAMGFAMKGQIAGRLQGSMQFAPSPAKGTGDFTLTGLRVEGLVADRPPVTVETARIRFDMTPSKDRFVLSTFEATLPDFSATARGTREGDGALDFSAEVKGDLGGALARARDLGFLPGEFSVNGTLDAAVRVAGKADALVIEVPRLTLVEKDARIEASGTRAADGALDFKASGAGDLGALFGRAAADGATTQGLENVKGRFAFEATAKGRADALVVDVPKLSVEGDVHLDAHGRLAADGALDAEVADLSGRIDDVLLLLRRMALLDRDVSIPGRVALSATVKGTREKPEVPRATLKTTDGPIALEVKGSLAATGALDADATATADLAAVADILRRAGFTTTELPLEGRATVTAKAAGTRERIDVPQFRLVVDGPAAVDVSGSRTADGVLSANGTASGDVDRLVRFAHKHGFVKSAAAATGCTFELRGVAAGTLDKLEVPNAQFALRGPLRVDATGRMSADRTFDVSGKADGALRPLLELASAWSGEPPPSIDGTLRAAFGAAGKPDRFDVTLPSLSIAAQGMQIEAEGAHRADGKSAFHAKASGAVADLIRIARVFGQATDVEATGRVDADVAATATPQEVRGSLTLMASDLVVTSPDLAGKPIREPRLALTIQDVRYDLETKSLAPVKARVEVDGARIDATAKSAGDVLTVEGTLVAEERFALNHVEPRWDTNFKIVSGRFQFTGDATKGRAKAQDWTGGFTLDAGSVKAPYVDASKAKLVGKLGGGSLVVDPIEATVNGGPVTGKATIGLVGDAPEHKLVLNGKDVEIDADLAPLVAHASPLFAVGENGRTGGKASLDVDLAAKGVAAGPLKRSLTGKGSIGLDGAYVQSTNWIGEMLQFVGAGDRLDIGNVKIPFEVKDAKVTTGEAPIEGVGLLMRLGGDVSILDGKLDYLLRVKTASGAGGKLERIASLLDKDGYVPLRLGGTLSKPKLKLPDVKDALKGAFDDLLGGKRDDDKPEKDKKPKRQKPKPGDEPAPKSGETPPLPPPPGEEPPPPPAPGDGEEEPPPPPK